MKKLKLFFACLLMAVLSIGQVWGADNPYTYTFSSFTQGSPVVFNVADPALTITLAVAQSGGNTTKPQWNAGSSQARVYAGGSLTVAIEDATIDKIVFDYAVNASSGTKPTITGVAGTTTAGTWDADKKTWEGSDTEVVFSTSGTKGNVGFKTLTIYYTPSGSSDKPNLSMTPAASCDFVGSQEITLNTTTDGASIYYTLDGSTPSSGSTPYTAAFTITETKTVSAIAIKGSNSSDVISRTFTKVTPLTTIDEIFAAATAAGSTEVTKFITFNNWVVTAVKGNNAYVSDGTKGFVIYGSGHGFVVGNTLSGTVSCKVKLYNNYAQLGSLTSTTTGLTVGTGGSVTPVEIDDADDLNSYGGAYTGSVIKLTGTCTTANSKLYILGVQLWNNLFSYTNPTVGKDYHCTGVYYYGGTTYGHEIMPRNASDIEEVAEAGAPEAPEFTPTPDTYNEIKNVTITCETDEAVTYYTMTNDGSNPATPDTDDDSQIYTGPISLSTSGTYKFKAVAFKNDLTSTEVSATYVINLPLPSHTFQVTHKFETGEGFVFPEGWSTSYGAHEIAYTDDEVVFASANQQNPGSTIDDCPVTKGDAISLVLTNSTKIITAVRFDYKQWAEKTSALEMKYSTDGGANWTACTTSETASFAIQDLTLPSGVNAIQVTGTSGNQIGLKSIAFDLDDKPIVKKVVNITAPAAVEGTLVVKNGEDPISDGDEIAVGTTLKIFATPESGYTLTAINVVDEDDDPVSINSENEFEVPNKNVTVSAVFTEIVDPATLILNIQGTESPYPGSHNVGDEIPLPTTATVCDGNVFVGWSEVLIATPGAKPTTKYYDKGAQYTLAEETQTLYAVYAQSSNATWQIASEDLEILDSETSSAYAKYAGDQSKSGITYNIADVMPATGDNTGKLQIKKSSGKLYNKTSFTADIESIVIDGYNIAVFAGEEVISSTPASGAITGTGTGPYTYQFPSGKRYFHIQNNTNNAAYPASITVNFQPEYSNYTTSCIVPVTVPDPEFDVAGGTYTEVKTVKIDNYDDDYIYVYTLDGSVPTADSNLDPEGTAEVYDDAIGIVIDASCTLKARAYDIDGNFSDVTIATYTINLPLSTIPDIFDAATGTQTEVTITMGNWVVSGVGVGSTTNEKTVYVTDGTNGFIIFAASHGFEVGDVLSGTITCDLKKYYGSAELMDVTTSTPGLTVTKGGTVPTASVAPASLSGLNTGALIALSNWKYDGEYLTDGTTDIKPFNTLFTFDALTENKYYNVTGIYLQYGTTTKEILPRSAADIEELSANAPTMTWYTSGAKATTIAANATYSITVGDAFAPVFETNSNGELTYSSDNSAVATIDPTTGELSLTGNTGNTIIKCAVAADAVNNFAADEQSFTLRVREAAIVDNVVIVAQYDGQWYAMKNTVVSKTAGAIAVTYVDGVILNATSEDIAAITWKRTVDSEGNVTFQNPTSDEYLKNSGNDLAMSAGESGDYQWTLFNGYYRTGVQTRTFIYREGQAGFRNYAVGNAETADYSALPVVTPAVFKDIVRDGLTNGKWGTLCPKQTVENVAGATFYQIAYLEDKDGKPFNMHFDEVEGATLTAGQPYFFIASGELIIGNKTGAALDAAGAGVNGFYGYIGASPMNLSWRADYDVNDNNTFVIYDNSVYRINGDTQLKSERCYININDSEPSRTPVAASLGRRRITMSVNTKDAAQGFENLEASETPMKVMIEGQLFIIRGEKVFDATGRLVK